MLRLPVAIDLPRGVVFHEEVPSDQRASLLSMIDGFYDGNPELQRDEAVRSASLAAMTLMLAARNRGRDRIACHVPRRR